MNNHIHHGESGGVVIRDKGKAKMHGNVYHTEWPNNHLFSKRTSSTQKMY